LLLLKALRSRGHPWVVVVVVLVVVKQWAWPWW
jgi:hypothetical protein